MTAGVVETTAKHKKHKKKHRNVGGEEAVFFRPSNRAIGKERNGGVENFVRCHLCVIKMLDFIKQTGLATVPLTIQTDLSRAS